MVTRLALSAAALVAAFAGGYLAHRPRTITVEHTHEAQAQQQARVDTSTSSAARVVTVQGPERIVYRTFACQDGKVSSERIEERGPAREVATTQAQGVTHSNIETKILTVDRVVKVPDDPTGWIVSAVAGTDRLAVRPDVLGAQVQYKWHRLVMGVQGTSQPALMVTIGGYFK